MIEKSDHSFHWRFWECFPAVISLSIICVPVIFSFFFPTQVAIFVVLYTFVWFLFSAEYMLFLVYASHKSHKIDSQDWAQKLQNLKMGKDLPKKQMVLRQKLKDQHDWIDPDDVRHLVIVATCGEEIEILRESIGSLRDAHFDTSRLYVCIATEERKKESGRANAQILQEEFGNIFGKFFWTEHPDGIAGEVRGKGGNITHAGREVTQQLENSGEDISRIMVTTLDADNKVDAQYFSALTYHFCLQEKRQQKSYQPIPLFFNNIWDVPLLNRMVAIGSCLWHMIVSGRPDKLRNFASHAQPLGALKQMDFWGVKTIVEDSFQFWKSYLHFRGDYSVVPLFIPIYQDAVMNKNYYRSLEGQYKQTRRWAWGCSNIPYFAVNAWRMRRELPIAKTFFHFINLIQGFIMWATAAIFITLSYPVPRFLNSYFGETIVASNMGYLLEVFFKVALFGIILSMALSIFLLPKAPTIWKKSSLIWQWIFLPIMTIVMGSIPALEAQVRLACKKPLEFNVTEKVRVKKE